MKTQQEQELDPLLKTENKGFEERMIWSYPDWNTDADVLLSEIELQFNAPNSISLKIKIKSTRIKSTKHPYLIIKIFDKEKNLVADWSTKAFVIICGNPYYYIDKAEFGSLYHRAYSAKIVLAGYEYRNC